MSGVCRVYEKNQVKKTAFLDSGSMMSIAPPPSVGFVSI
jgi:hypothetical protein